MRDGESPPGVHREFVVETDNERRSSPTCATARRNWGSLRDIERRFMRPWCARRELDFHLWDVLPLGARGSGFAQVGRASDKRLAPQSIP
jgi:hypothetical protein